MSAKITTIFFDLGYTLINFRGNVDRIVTTARELRQNFELQGKLRGEFKAAESNNPGHGGVTVCIAQFHLPPGPDGEVPGGRVGRGTISSP